ncbi:MAG: hypothetical protein ACOY41_02730 [Pseudomonadota bacterium]
MNKIKALNLRIGALFVASLAAADVFAIETLSDGEMAGVVGADGITATVSAPQISVSTLGLCFDSSTTCSTAYTGADASALNIKNLSWRGVDMNGLNLGSTPVSIKTTVDAFNNTAATLPGLAIGMTWNRMRMQIDQLAHGNITNSTGTFALDASGSFNLRSTGGIFNGTRNDSSLYLALNDADLYWRQGAAGAPELLFNNIDFLWDMPAGRVGINPTNGLVIEGNVNFNLTFDLRYQFAPAAAAAFTVGTNTEDIPAVRYGWSGTLLNGRVTAIQGGSWTGGVGATVAPNQLYDRAAKTNGITYSLRWDLEDSTPAVGNTEFKVILGYVADPTAIEFGNWTKLPNTAQPASQPALTTYGFDIPILAFDMLRAAGTNPGGLCWGANWEGPQGSCEASVHGGQFLNLAPEDHDLAVILRDGFLRAYSQSVRIVDPPNPTQVYGWALIYTLGNIDGNIYFRPDTRTAGSVGAKMDMLLMSQTFDVFDSDGDGNTWEQGPNWGYGTHFMIADTDAQLGIGLLNASFLLMGDNQYVKLINTGVSIGEAAETASPVRWHVRGIVGGGDLPNMNTMVKLANWDGNFEFDRFNLTLKPPAAAGETYVGYDFSVRFANTGIPGFSHNTAGDGSDDGSYLSLSEPGRPTKDFRLADARGWYGARNGRIQLYSDNDTPVGVPAQLVLQNDLLMGASVPGVGAAASDVFQVGRVEFANRDIGTLVVPSGQWYLSIGLRPQ